MAVINIASEVPKSIQWLRRLSRISAWLLLATVAVLVVSGWGITHTDVIYKATFHLIDRGLADSIHRATNLPLMFFFLSHVLINIRLLLTGKKTRQNWFIDGGIIIVGLALLGVFAYVEYLA
jgi:succinate dehydrogenase/fumarate reductase cytochrome b subunit